MKICEQRWMGLDYGDKTIGVAVSDPTGRIALGVETIRRPDAQAFKPSIRRLGELIEHYGISAIVLGYPKRMDNSESERCAKTMLFKDKLTRNFKRISVTLWDERYSTAGVMRAFDGTRAQAKTAVDEMAAVFILQGYLDYHATITLPPRKENTMNDEFSDVFSLEDEDHNGAITMFDDEGNESKYTVLASREDGDCLYMLVEETLTEDEGNDDVAEVLHFKCISSDDDEMIFELVDEEHEDFEKVFALFKKDYDELGIEY